jgi:aminopeptidase N
MKKSVPLFLFIFCCICANAQTSFEQIVESEQKSFLHLHKAERSAASDCNINYTRLELTVDPAVKYIAGTVTTVFIPDNLMSSIEFDLSDSLQVDSVVYHNTTLGFNHGSDVVHINFINPLNAGEADSIKVYYQGVPAGGNGFGSFVQGLHDSVPIIWTLSEPYGAKDWWPCQQNLSDKIDSIDILVIQVDVFLIT